MSQPRTHVSMYIETHPFQKIGLHVAVHFHRQRADKESAREVELEKATAKAAEDWKLKPLPENAER